LYIPEYKIPGLRSIIHSCFTDKFDASRVQSIADAMASLIDAHYFAVLLFPNRFVSRPLFISNNPPDFMGVYAPLIPKDFLIRNLVHSHRITLLHELADWGFQQSDEFCIEVQRIRPISDVIYVPIKLSGCLAGYWALGRAGLDNLIFSKNDVDIFQFAAGFLTESFKRSLKPKIAPESSAYLDAFGHVVSAGTQARVAFNDLFGKQHSGYPSHGLGAVHQDFAQRFTQFLNCRINPSSPSFTLVKENRTYSLTLSFLETATFRIRIPSQAQIEVRISRACKNTTAENLLDFPLMKNRFALSNRECAIVGGIYKGFTNKDIGNYLGIEESTVKHHMYHIYEKAGVRSRTQLILNLNIF